MGCLCNHTHTQTHTNKHTHTSCRGAHLQLRAELGQVQEHVARGAHDGRGAGQLALGPDQLRGVQQVAAAVALVAAGVLRGRVTFMIV